MAENEDSEPIPPVEIRIRKGSDAPSLGEGKIAGGAPMASFELSDIEDSDVEHPSDTGEDVFARSDSPNLGVPNANYKSRKQQPAEESGGEEEEEEEEADSGNGEYAALDDDNETEEQVQPQPPPPSPNVSSVKVVGLHEEIELDLTERTLDPVEAAEVEAQIREAAALDAEDGLDDRSATPTNEVQHTEAVSASPEPLSANDGGKIKINLPGHKHKHKKHKEDKHPPRPPPPGKSGPPPRPAPPGAGAHPVQPPAPAPTTSWVTFDLGETEEKIGPPPRPNAPPPKKPPQPKRPPPPSKKPEGPKIKSDSVDEGDGGFDEESELCSTDKEKKKSKIFSTKKLTKLVDPKKLKPGKKEKKEKKTIDESELAKKFEKPADEKSADWDAFQKLLNKSETAVQESSVNLKEMETGFEGEIAKLEATSATNSPWANLAPDGSSSTVLSPTDSQSSGSEVKKDWVGFDDNFSITPNIASGQHLAHLNVTPVPSPAHAPVPPNNSARGSQEDLAGREAEADLLGISTDTGTLEDTQGAPVDFLGLDDIGNEEHALSEVPICADILSLSRNPVASNRSSQNPSPTAELDGPVEASATALGLVDEILGIDSNSIPKPRDPLQELLKKASSKEDEMESDDGETKADENSEAEHTEPASEPASGPNEFGVDAPLMFGDDDDPFGLGTTVSSNPVAAATSPLVGELLGLGEEKPVENGASEEEPTKDRIDPTTPDLDDFDPRADINLEKLGVSAARDKPILDIKATVRPRPKSAAASASANPFRIALITREDDLMGEEEYEYGAEDEPTSASNPFTSGGEFTYSETNPFADHIVAQEDDGKLIPSIDDQESGELDIFAESVSAAEAVSGGSFNPFATITEGEPPQASGDDNFDPFQTIHGDDAFEVHFPSGGQEGVEGDATSPRINPFDKEPPLDEKFSGLEPKTSASEDEGKSTPRQITSSEASMEEDEELEPLPPYHEIFTGDGYNLLLRQPTKKKLTQNRYWKPVYIRLQESHGVPAIRVFINDKTPDCMQELPLQPSYNLCNMGLQQFDQYGKCHTVKIQYVFYRERVGMKAERIAPTLGDLVRLKDLKGLKDLVHKPKTTMILDHSPQTSELLKIGGFDYGDFRTFMREIEDRLFRLECQRDKTQEYTKDEVTIDIVDEYFVDIDRDGHIVSHKARVRVFCLAFLSGTSWVEVGLNDRRRKGREIVGRKDIIPIKTDEWIRIEDAELHSVIDTSVFDDTKVLKFAPLDAIHFEVMRFRCRPKMNREMPLQIRAQMSVVDRHVEIRSDIIIPGYYSNSRKAQQTPCEDIQIRFPIPEAWIYLLRVEKRFKYGSVKSATRKPGKIKGFERLTQMAQGFLPPSLIEVSSGSAKYENVFHGIVWRIPRLPERNQGAYKTHLFTLKMDLGPHDAIPEEYERHIDVEYNMPNSMVSRAQVRSIGVSTTADDPPDRWVHHLAKYEYRVEIEFNDRPKAPLQDIGDGPMSPETPRAAIPEETEVTPPVKKDEDDTDSDSSDSSDSD